MLDFSIDQLPVDTAAIEIEFDRDLPAAGDAVQERAVKIKASAITIAASHSRRIMESIPSINE